MKHKLSKFSCQNIYNFEKAEMNFDAGVSDPLYMVLGDACFGKTNLMKAIMLASNLVWHKKKETARPDKKAIRKGAGVGNSYLEYIFKTYDNTWRYYIEFNRRGVINEQLHSVNVIEEEDEIKYEKGDISFIDSIENKYALLPVLTDVVEDNNTETVDIYNFFFSTLTVQNDYLHDKNFGEHFRILDDEQVMFDVFCNMASLNESVHYREIKDLKMGRKCASKSLTKFFSVFRHLHRVHCYEQIVLIDDLMEHMSPKMQRVLIEYIRSVDIKTQIIFTARSPLLLAAPSGTEPIKEKNVFLLEKHKVTDATELVCFEEYGAYDREDELPEFSKLATYYYESGVFPCVLDSFISERDAHLLNEEVEDAIKNEEDWQEVFQSTDFIEAMNREVEAEMESATTRISGREFLDANKDFTEDIALILEEQKRMKEDEYDDDD